MEDSKIILSIGVPVFNVDKYLRKCVDSLLVQDLSSSTYEIILVDDGSTDACPQICDEYAAEHANICVVHQANAGLSAARNTSIAAAKGDYLMFVDSDDFLEPNVLAGLLKQVEHDNLDVLRFKYQNVNERYEVFNPYKRDARLGNDYTTEPTDGVTFLNTRMNTQCYAWAFILRRDLIYSQLSALDSCLFTEGIYFEDTDWTPRMLVRAQRVASTDKIVYNYLLTRQGSITNAVNKSKQKKVLDDKMRLVGEMQRQANELQRKGLSNAWFSRMIADIVISIVGILSVDFYDERKEYMKKLKENNVFPIQSRLFKALMINVSLEMTINLMRIKNKIFQIVTHRV